MDLSKRSMALWHSSSWGPPNRAPLGVGGPRHLAEFAECRELQVGFSRNARKSKALLAPAVTLGVPPAWLGWPGLALWLGLGLAGLS